MQAKRITVFIRSNKFNKKNQLYYRDKTYSFILPTNDLFEIVRLAVEALSSIYKPGIKYKKAGVLLSDLSSEGIHNRDLFFRDQRRIY